MNDTFEKLHEYKVKDIMSLQIWSVSKNATIVEAEKLLVEHDISGLPVIDEMGKCVGVVSNSDIIRRCYRNSQGDGYSSVANEVEVSHEGAYGSLQIEVVPEDRVERHMSSAVQTIGVEQSVIDAARYISGENIHRLIVVDERACPIGVVSALDILQTIVDADHHTSILKGAPQ